MTINEFLKKEMDGKFAPRLILADGESLSVQASSGHYCSPRLDYSFPYTELEIGYPSIPLPAEFMKYCEDKDDPTETVYGFVPVKLIDKFIADHGGIKADS